MATTVLDSHIESSPGVAGGKPRIAGRRITVQDIVIWHEWMGRGPDEIAADHDLTLAEVHGALAYYYDHREAVDKAIKEGREVVRKLRRKTPSKVVHRLHGKGHSVLRG